MTQEQKQSPTNARGCASFDAWPVAYGYAQAHDTAYHLAQILSQTCATHQLQLVKVFFDAAECESRSDRPGFATALDALDQPETVALVIPDLDHLSADAHVRDALLRAVFRTGADVLTADMPVSRYAPGSLGLAVPTADDNVPAVGAASHQTTQAAGKGSRCPCAVTATTNPDTHEPDMRRFLGTPRDLMEVPR